MINTAVFLHERNLGVEGKKSILTQYGRHIHLFGFDLIMHTAVCHPDAGLLAHVVWENAHVCDKSTIYNVHSIGTNYQSIQIESDKHNTCRDKETQGEREQHIYSNLFIFVASFR